VCVCVCVRGCAWRWYIVDRHLNLMVRVKCLVWVTTEVQDRYFLLHGGPDSPTFRKSRYLPWRWTLNLCSNIITATGCRQDFAMETKERGRGSPLARSRGKALVGSGAKPRAARDNNWAWDWKYLHNTQIIKCSSIGHIGFTRCHT